MCRARSYSGSASPCLFWEHFVSNPLLPQNKSRDYFTALGKKTHPPQYMGAVFIHYDILCKINLFERPTFYNHDSELSGNLFSNKAFLSVFQGAK